MGVAPSDFRLLGDPNTLHRCPLFTQSGRSVNVDCLLSAGAVEGVVGSQGGDPCRHQRIIRPTASPVLPGTREDSLVKSARLNRKTYGRYESDWKSKATEGILLHARVGFGTAGDSAKSEQGEAE